MAPFYFQNQGAIFGLRLKKKQSFLLPVVSEVEEKHIKANSVQLEWTGAVTLLLSRAETALIRTC